MYKILEYVIGLFHGIHKVISTWSRKDKKARDDPKISSLYVFYLSYRGVRSGSFLE